MNGVSSRKKKQTVETLIERYFGEIPLVPTASHITSFPNMHSYKHLLEKHKYTLSQLKEYTTFYTLQSTGTKLTLSRRLYCFLHMSANAVKIQKQIRGKIAREFLFLHGPAARNKRLCTNADDFVTMEPIENIPFVQFTSYQDVDGFVYGFDLASLYNLFQNSGKEVQNPYNRSLFPKSFIENTLRLIRLSELLEIPVELQFEDVWETASKEKVLELRTLSLFQSIDALGNYSDANWFLSLTRQLSIEFIRHLLDIWNYRAQLPQQTKYQICPPFGDPFRHIYPTTMLNNQLNLCVLKTMILTVMENLVNTGIDKDSKALGAYYVLGALTLVNHNAALALPWLFQSMNYF